MTSEVAIFPSNAAFDDFSWRVSIARVEHGGPFSLFEGIDRKLALLEGSVSLALLEGSVSLAIEGQDSLQLTKHTPPVSFPGDVATNASVIEGPVTDLNVMTRRGVFSARMIREKGAAIALFDPLAHKTIILALTETTLRDGEAEVFLAAGDAVFVERGVPSSFSFSPDFEFYRIEIIHE